jgi:hypothetical protein
MKNINFSVEYDETNQEARIAEVIWEIGIQYLIDPEAASAKFTGSTPVIFDNAYFASNS